MNQKGIQVDVPEGWTCHSRTLISPPWDGDDEEDIWQATRDGWCVDVGGDNRLNMYVCRVVKDADWVNPVEIKHIKDPNEVVEWISKSFSTIERSIELTGG